RSLVAKPSLANATAAELLDELKSTERWVRYQARRALASINQDREDPLRALASWITSLSPSDALYERYLMEALATCEMFDSPETNLLNRLLIAKDPRARAYATEVVGRWNERFPNALTLLARSAQDDHPRVRVQAVVAASRIPDAHSIEVALSAVDHPVDRFL